MLRIAHRFEHVIELAVNAPDETFAFRMAAFLPFNDAARMPLGDYPAVVAWYARLQALPAWSDPFEGLDAPELPSVSA